MNTKLITQTLLTVQSQICQGSFRKCQKVFKQPNFQKMDVFKIKTISLQNLERRISRRENSFYDFLIWSIKSTTFQSCTNDECDHECTVPPSATVAAEGNSKQHTGGDGPEEGQDVRSTHQLTRGGWKPSRYSEILEHRQIIGQNCNTAK